MQAQFYLLLRLLLPLPLIPIASSRLLLLHRYNTSDTYA